jgi:hypothetical protein
MVSEWLGDERLIMSERTENGRNESIADAFNVQVDHELYIEPARKAEKDFQLQLQIGVRKSFA